MKEIAKHLARALLGEYAIYQVWTSTSAPTMAAPVGVALGPVEPILLESAAEPVLRASAWYKGAEARAFGAFENGHLLVVAWFWWGHRYRARKSWPLPDGAAKLVHIVTAPAARGRGLAPLLISYAEHRMRAEGFSHLLARVWHSNEPSRRAFQRAGWRPIGWMFEANPLRLSKPWHVKLRALTPRR